MRGQPRYITRPHARLPHSFRGMDAWMTSQLNVALIRMLRGSLTSVIFFIHGYLYNQALADVRSIGAGIEFLHYRMCGVMKKTSVF